MKAIVLESDGRLVYRSVPDPQFPDPRFPGGGVLVRVVCAGVCGSDLPRAFGGKAYRYPLILGHEFSGVVAAVGWAPDAPGAAAGALAARPATAGAARSPVVGEGCAVGDRVAVYPLVPCGHCGPCQVGEYAQCESYDYFGSRRDGGFAEYVVVPAENLVRVPDTLDLVSAAMAEPCAVALHGVEKLRIQAGASALVIGGGPVGLLAAQWLRVKGCGSVLVSEPDAWRRKMAGRLGFEAVDPSIAGALELALKSGPGRVAGPEPGSASGLAAGSAPGSEPGSRGAELVVEACGLPATFRQAIAAAGRFGQVLFMGNIAGELRIPETEVSAILRKELSIFGTWNSRIVPRGRDEWTASLQAMASGKVDCASLVSHRPDLSEGVRVLESMAQRRERFAKVIFTVGGGAGSAEVSGSGKDPVPGSSWLPRGPAS